MTDPNPSSTPPAPPARMPLEEWYPACFDWNRPQPLKLGIHRDLIAAGHDPKRVRRALGAYCRRPSYQKALRVGATRLDLQGQPAGVVTAADIELAQANQAARAAAARAARPPNDTPLPKENLVPGRLELTVKFSELPQPLRVQDGVKIGVQTGMGIVTALLPPPLWRTLERAAQDYPRWVAVLSGALDRFADGEIALKHPTLRVFEKKAKPEATPDARVPDPKAPEAQTPAPTYPKLTLKGRNTSKAD